MEAVSDGYSLSIHFSTHDRSDMPQLYHSSYQLQVTGVVFVEKIQRRQGVSNPGTPPQRRLI
jgi:hypothetical protein